LDRQLSYLPVLVVLLIVSLEPLVFFFFLDFLVLFMVLVSVPWLLVEVFWAKTTVPESSERPRAAIMIFFILGISPI
jgi:hypothetical protein